MTDPGYYDQSIPPALLVGARRSALATGALQAPPVAAGADQQTSSLLVRAGAPASYVPEVKATARPRNVTELNSAGVTAEPATPWTAGQYVTVGTSGKRAHWNGEEWRGGESPGYPATVTSAPRHAVAEDLDVVDDDDLPMDAARMSPPPLPPAPYTTGTQFPGDEQPGDLTR